MQVLDLKSLISKARGEVSSPKELKRAPSSPKPKKGGLASVRAKLLAKQEAKPSLLNRMWSATKDKALFCIDLLGGMGPAASAALDNMSTGGGGLVSGAVEALKGRGELRAEAKELEKLHGAQRLASPSMQALMGFAMPKALSRENAVGRVFEKETKECTERELAAREAITETKAAMTGAAGGAANGAFSIVTGVLNWQGRLAAESMAGALGTTTEAAIEAGAGAALYSAAGVTGYIAVGAGVVGSGVAATMAAAGVRRGYQERKQAKTRIAMLQELGGNPKASRELTTLQREIKKMEALDKEGGAEGKKEVESRLEILKQLSTKSAKGLTAQYLKQRKLEARRDRLAEELHRHGEGEKAVVRGVNKKLKKLEKQILSAQGELTLLFACAKDSSLRENTMEVAHLEKKGGLRKMMMNIIDFAVNVTLTAVLGLGAVFSMGAVPIVLTSLAVVIGGIKAVVVARQESHRAKAAAILQRRAKAKRRWSRAKAVLNFVGRTRAGSIERIQREQRQLELEASRESSDQVREHLNQQAKDLASIRSIAAESKDRKELEGKLEQWSGIEEQTPPSSPTDTDALITKQRSANHANNLKA